MISGSSETVGRVPLGLPAGFSWKSNPKEPLVPAMIRPRDLWRRLLFFSLTLFYPAIKSLEQTAGLSLLS
ncbi:hypothetical protein ACOMHN_053896 [Nucella lapillus]